MGGTVRRALFLSIAVLLVAVAARCDSKPGREGPVNPLDRENPTTGGDPYGLDATYLEGKISLKWNAIGVPGLQGVTIFRKTQFDSLFARVDTVGGTIKTWVDGNPVYFAKIRYRIAPIGSDGSEADTVGRGLDSVTVPPFLRIAAGAAVTAVREVPLFIGAAFADEMILSEDSSFADASWEPFDSAATRTLSGGQGTKRIYLKVRREGGETSDRVFGTIETASTAGALVLAGGDSLTARRWVSAAASGSLMTRLVLSTDETFGDAGDSVYDFDSSTTGTKTVSWLFDNTLATKVLFAEFSNGFGVERVAVDSIRPDDLSAASALLAAGSETSTVCEVTLTVSARALYMMLSPDSLFADDTWIPYQSNSVWWIGDSAGTYAVHVNLMNDFASRVVRDGIVFEPIPLAVVIDSPADSAFFSTGNSFSVRGGVIAASCREAPDTVYVEVGDSLFAVALGDTTSWAAPEYTFTESPSGTLAVTLVATVSDEADSAAADTVTVFLVGGE